MLKKLTVGTKNEYSRLEWLEKTLKKIPQKSRILDAGAGELKYKDLCEHLKYVSQDFGKYDGAGDGIGKQTKEWNNSILDIICDITDIPEKDDSFDAIMCIEVFEHLPDPISAIKEFSRLLQEEGHLIITAPFCSLTHFSPYHFYTGFNKNFYVNHLSDYGFKIIDIQPNGNYFEYIAQELRRLNSVAKKYSNKNLKIYEKLMIKTFLYSLEKLSKNDHGSSELLNFGYFVHAIKK
ncbi:class I SAM-dependent methyltransferase [Patescibacteria group bacterium]|nr:methyltransferase domain-containing protein [Candidatus Falkowbacteria bacterium]MBU3906166.1 class I SAM-dependent methyltransferase [Patescibacteria group bacterium]MCG2697504.1 class I SAM-dependent methyltransferase [Candidatus Parcubacteria bacterium]MBU4014986.1 class I SAM-dependent methyltransferase [Patescibacteria group bacterium]MBU4026659.1 class I SAM-dependent methyltransferase [Patescibacteria group bacterium]